MMQPLLQVEHVTKIFSAGFFNNRRQAAVDDVSLVIPDGAARTVALAGESGSGKTTLAQMIQGFLPPTEGHILFQGQDIYTQNTFSKKSTPYFQLVQTVFQNPFETFNPFYPIDHIFDLTIRHYELAENKSEARRLIMDILLAVNLDPNEILGRYQHQLSGGQLQRLMIARALLLKPKLLIADEPVSMVDVSLRAMILDLMVSLKNEYGISIVYITHDLSTALQIADDILIMYQGNLVEVGDALTVIQQPAHPYTQLLVQSIPLPDPSRKWSQALKPDEAWSQGVEGGEPNGGCKFYPRCPKRMDICLTKRPPLVTVQEKQQAACFIYPEK